MGELAALIREGFERGYEPLELAEKVDEFYWEKFQVSVLSDWERFELGMDHD